ncbi:class 1 isoprenoid biosynthesis enzyme [Streptomyces sp. NPDC004610]|uniref:class 1 isoprenoid biosynthesis enzyme n=1 Tax=unclassified Streptomyces TaxID=2593676 RepID=UPI0033A6C1A3
MATSYRELHRRMAPDIAAERAAALDLLGPRTPELRSVVARLLDDRTFKSPLSVLPLLVHGAETGVPDPALPLAAVHDLWWTSACWMDDLADTGGAYTVGGLDPSDALLAAVITGTPLPLLVVQSARVPEPLRGVLSREIVTCWVRATEGQLRDLHGVSSRVTREAVAEAYAAKSGAPFSMVTAMAAQLAGAPGDRVERWREFGVVLGILWQILNDQDDILSGRNEDLDNGTVTYLLACAYDAADPESARRLPQVHGAARDSPAAREELAGLLLSPAALQLYEQSVAGFRDRALTLLDETGGDPPYRSALGDLLRESARVLLRPGLRLTPA